MKRKELEQLSLNGMARAAAQGSYQPMPAQPVLTAYMEEPVPVYAEPAAPAEDPEYTYEEEYPVVDPYVSRYDPYGGLSALTNEAYPDDGDEPEDYYDQ